MKWCMVATVAFALLFGGMAWAQDDFDDLDSLLGGFDEPAAEAPPPAAPADDFGFAADDASDWNDDSSAWDTDADPFADVSSDVAVPQAEATPSFADDAMFSDLFADDVPAAVEQSAEQAADAFAAEFEQGMNNAFDAFGDQMAAGFEAAMMQALPEMLQAAIDSGELNPDDLSAEDRAELEALLGTSIFDNAGGFDAPFTSAAASVVAPAEKATPEVIQQTAAQEEVRRQAAEATALRSSENGFRLLSEENYLAAENEFSSALATLPDRPQNQGVREQISWGLAEAQYLRARGMVQRNERLTDARKLVDSAMKTAPNHKGAIALDKRLSKLEAAAAIPKPPKKQPATIEKAQNIDAMYDEARQWYDMKDYDKATALFERILAIDPYHKSSLRYLRKIGTDQYKLASYEREATRERMMAGVRKGWSPPNRAAIEAPKGDGEGDGRSLTPQNDQLQRKMQEIIIPVVEFRQANINDVVNFLVDASIAADPQKEGVNIILSLGTDGGAASAAPAPAPVQDDWGWGMDNDYGMSSFTPSSTSGGSSTVPPITLNLRRVSMLDAIKYITQVANLKYRIDDTVVMITRADAPDGNIITRMYPVQPSFMNVVIDRQGTTAEDYDKDYVGMTGRTTFNTGDVKEFFEKTGVRFPAGASITYNSSISQLIVANTADNLETFERILQQINVVPNQVEIEARFIEIDQTDLEELGFQWILNDNYEIATKKDGSGGRIQANANQYGMTQGLRFFGYNAGNLAVEPTSVLTQTSNQTILGGILSASSVLTNPEVTVVLQAISQHGGSDLLSAPRVTTRSGVNAQIQVVREIIYPTEFDVTQPTMNSDGNVTMSPVVTPGTFETRETGVILNVTPTVGPDGYTIDLVMAPEVAELVDWIQYGSAITVETGIIGARQSNTYQFNMPMPVFTSRNVTTSIVIWDGATVVMGGLIREELVTIKDKVPILGDIPLLGWFFRSEGQYSRKKNLLIFVTARLVDPAGRTIRREGTMPLGDSADSDLASVSIQ